MANIVDDIIYRALNIFVNSIRKNSFREYSLYPSAWGCQISETKCYQNVRPGYENFKQKYFLQRKELSFILKIMYNFTPQSKTRFKGLQYYSIYLFVVLLKNNVGNLYVVTSSVGTSSGNLRRMKW